MPYSSTSGSTGVGSSRTSRYDLESSRSRSYSHSGLYDQGGYRSRSSSVRETSPYDPERDRDLVLSMRSQSAMSGSRGGLAGSSGLNSRLLDRGPPVSTYTSASAGLLDDPMISTYSRSMTSDPLMTSSIVGGIGSASAAGMASAGGLGGPSLASSSKKYGSDEWSEATWLNSLRISAGMEPIPMPSSNSAAPKLAYEAVSTLPRMIRSNSSTDLRADLDGPLGSRGYSGGSKASGLGSGGMGNPAGRARHQTLAYGVSASDLNLRNSDYPVAGFKNSDFPVAGFSSTMVRNGSDNDILVARVPSREGEVYDVRGFESDMSAAIMDARVSFLLPFWTSFWSGFFCPKFIFFFRFSIAVLCFFFYPIKAKMSVFCKSMNLCPKLVHKSHDLQ